MGEPLEPEWMALVKEAKKSEGTKKQFLQYLKEKRYVYPHMIN
ncbi:anti-repressor SinI family protein [Fictibacillus enclensis]